MPEKLKKGYDNNGQSGRRVIYGMMNGGGTASMKGGEMAVMRGENRLNK
jgi:hypothetical protein